LLSPDSFCDICLPFLREIFDAITLPNHLHICGHVNKHLSVLRETGAHAISIDACVDLEAAARIFAPNTVALGHIDCTGVLLRGSPAEVAKTTVLMLNAMSGFDNYIQAFLDVVRSKNY
jgi:uroporphyrinogen-III decarboxylase